MVLLEHSIPAIPGPNYLETWLMDHGLTGKSLRYFKGNSIFPTKIAKTLILISFFFIPIQQMINNSFLHQDVLIIIFFWF